MTTPNNLEDEFEGFLNDNWTQDPMAETMTIEEAKGKLKALLASQDRASRLDELTKIGRLLNGKRIPLIDHYEERYNYLKGVE